MGINLRDNLTGFLAMNGHLGAITTTETNGGQPGASPTRDGLESGQLWITVQSAVKGLSDSVRTAVYFEGVSKAIFILRYTLKLALNDGIK